jgi:hypothetical protein
MGPPEDHADPGAAGLPIAGPRQRQKGPKIRSGLGGFPGPVLVWFPLRAGGSLPQRLRFRYWEVAQSWAALRGFSRAQAGRGIGERQGTRQTV